MKSNLCQFFSFLLSAVFFLLILSTTAMAATITWTGGGDGTSWDDNANRIENGGNAPGFGAGPYVINSGDIDAEDMRIGTNPGGGYFINTVTGTVTLVDGIHWDGTLCNQGTMTLGGTFFNHGGLVDCCGFIETPEIQAKTNPVDTRIATFMCIYMCQGDGSDSAKKDNWDGLVDVAGKVSIDEEETHICGFNSVSDPGSPALEYPVGVIPNLNLWVRADKGLGSPSDGDAVAVWSGRSWNGYFVQQLTAANPILYQGDNGTSGNMILLKANAFEMTCAFTFHKFVKTIPIVQNYL